MSNFFSKIALSVGMFLVSLVGGHITGSANTQPINGSNYYLSGSGVTSSATSITVTSFTIPQNGYKIQQSDLSSIFYFTLEPGSNTRQEVVSCTTDTQNANGTATFGNCTRGLSPISPYTASSSLQFAHAGGTIIIFGTAAQLFNQYFAVANNNSVTGLTTFSDPPILTNAATSTNQAASISYVNGIAFGGGTVTVPGGGTGVASFPAGAILVGNGAGNILASSSPTVNYITATSTTVSSSFYGPVTVNGVGLLNASTSLTATTSIAASNINSRALILNNLPYAFPVGRAASSTVLSENGSGVLTWEPLIPARYTFATTTGMTVSGSAYATSTLVTIPANTLNASSTIDIQENYSCVSGSSSNCKMYIKDGTGAQFVSIQINTTNTETMSCNVRIQIFSSGNSVSSQIWVASGSCLDTSTATNSAIISQNGTSAINLSNQTTFNAVIFGPATTVTLASAAIVVNP